jgi:hypothetical protein
MVNGEFGHLVVVRQADNYGTQRQWLCKCECGNETVVRTGHLTSGSVKSCGCRQGSGRFVHGKATSSEYSIWQGIKSRCLNPKHPEYKNYGGRGIEVCTRWLLFANFYEDMGPRPPGLEVDRRDNDKGYSLDNCRWATRKEQCNNTRNVHAITLGGRTQSLTAWCEELGLKPATVHYRIRNGVPDTLALTMKKHAHYRLLT